MSATITTVEIHFKLSMLQSGLLALVSLLEMCSECDELLAQVRWLHEISREDNSDETVMKTLVQFISLVHDEHDDPHVWPHNDEVAHHISLLGLMWRVGNDVCTKMRNRAVVRNDEEEDPILQL